MKTNNNGTKLLSVTNADLKRGVFENNEILELADGCFYDMAKLKRVILPNLIKCGNDCFRYNAALTTVTVPKLAQCGNDCFSSNDALTTVTVPKLAQCGNDCFRSNDALTTVTVPKLAQCGNDCFRSNAALTTVTVPKLAQCGNYCFRSNAALTTVTVPKLAQCDNYCFSSNDALTTVRISQYKLTVKNADGWMFVIEAERTSKGIKIYSGANFLRIKEGKIQKDSCYVAEKGKFMAHGESIKKAVSDLQFKIIAEKLKNDPIKEDTVISVQYYRIVTGACEMGCKAWMKENNITQDKMKAKDLLPLLEKTSAYGVSRFRELITF